MSCHFLTQIGCRLHFVSGRSVQLTRNIRTSCCLKGKDLDLRKNKLPASSKDKKDKIKDPDRGTFMNWFNKNMGKDRAPKNMPTDPDKLDSIDRIAITSSNVDYDYNTVNLVASYYNTESKDWEHFNQVVEAYKKPDKSGMRVGQVEFIYGSLKRLKDFGLHKDVRAYNALLDVFPKGKMIPENVIQFGFLHYAKQQFCAIDLLEEMEWSQVLPDQKTIDLVLSIFSVYSQVFDKLGTMIYWTTKARYNDPYPCPNVLPYDPKELATISFRRMCVDPTTEISIYSTEAVPESIDKTWIVEAISPVQKKLINKLNEPLFIDGPHIMWLKDHMTSYFVLKTAAPKEFKENEEDLEDMRDLPLYAHGGLSKKQHIEKMEAIHKSSEGTICGLVATGTSSRDSLLSYIRILQHHLPKLKDLNIIFTQRAPESALYPLEEEKNDGMPKTNDESVKLLVNK